MRLEGRDEHITGKPHRTTSVPRFSPSSIIFGYTAIQTSSGAWGWLASSSQVLNHSEFHQSFILIRLSARIGLSALPETRRGRKRAMIIPF